MKKLFGKIDLTWKKIIIFSIITGIYTAIMALLPITGDTSFRDIAIQMEWWILFGVIIICNSKSPVDSALKCFIFFLISQPLIYLIQVPFSNLGWGIFRYYKYWFMWTILTLPMGYIGYYIKKNNIISAIILLPMLILLSYLGLGYLNSAIENFPHHLLSAICCFAFIIIIVLNILDKLKLRLFTFGITIISIIAFIIINGGLSNNTFEVVQSLNVDLEGKVNVTTFTATKKGGVELIPYNDSYNVKLKCQKGGKYTFELTDEDNKTYYFEYYYDKEQNTVILNQTKELPGFETEEYIDSDNTIFKTIKYHNRTYLPYGTIKDEELLNECIGFIIEDNNTRLYTLKDDKELNFIILSTETSKEIYRAIDTKEEKINIPKYINSSDYKYWK